MSLHIEALFRFDARGRLQGRRTLVAAPSAAPRFYLGRSQHGNQWRMRADLPADSVRLLSRYAGKERPLDVVDGAPAPPERIEAMRGALRRSLPVTREWRGPVYRFAERGGAGPERWAALSDGVRLLEPGDADARALLLGGFPQLASSLARRGPCFAVVEDREVRSVCYSACGQPGRAFEAGVETAQSHRGRGLAARCVAAWALAVMREGAAPLYSTEWDNRASRRVAEKLGLELYGEDLHMS